MASIVDAFNEAFNEDLSFLKIAVYSIPVYFCARWFLVGKMDLVYFWGPVVGILLFALLTQGINNVRMNKKEILTFNVLKLGNALVRACLVIIPYAIVLGYIGYMITTFVHIPIELDHVPLIFAIIVWSILGSILLTAYLSFAKYLKIWQGYNVPVIIESCVDVFISFLFFIPQLLAANVILVGPVAYIFRYFNLPFTHWGFVLYSSMIFVANISILANYFAQTAYENVKGNNEEYDDNHNKIDVINDSAERLNGK